MGKSTAGTGAVSDCPECDKSSGRLQLLGICRASHSFPRGTIANRDPDGISFGRTGEPSPSTRYPPWPGCHKAKCNQRTEACFHRDACRKLPAAALLRVRPGKGDVPPMSSDQELLNLAGAESENQSLFDELAGLVPAERQAEYYRVIAHTRTLCPNDEMLRVLEAMGILALLTRETPVAIAAERKSLQTILENALSKADAVEKRLAAYTSRLESRIAQLPKELETGLDPPRIARLLGESLRQCFQQSGLPDTAKALDQSCSEMNSVQEQLVNMLREVTHPDIGVIEKVRSANDSLLRSMTTRAQQMDDFLVSLEKQVWAIWLPVVSSAALALGFALGTWFANERQATPETTSAPQGQQVLTAPTDVPPQVLPHRRAKHP